MKQIFSKITIKLMLTVATITLIIGCSDVLDEDPLVQLSTEQFLSERNRRFGCSFRELMHV